MYKVSGKVFVDTDDRCNDCASYSAYKCTALQILASDYVDDIPHTENLRINDCHQFKQKTKLKVIK